MHAITWKTTLLAALVIGWSAAPACAGRQRRPAPPPVEMPSWVVRGYGETPADAESDALHNAGKSLADYLAKRHPGLDWTPSPAYLKQRRMVQPAGDMGVEELERAGRVHVVSLRVELSTRFLEDSQRQVRQMRMTERHRSLALGLGAAAVLLLTLVGYLRLEDATRGFLTLPLRLAALAALAAAAGALYLLA